MTMQKVNVSIIGEFEEGQKLYSVGVSSLNSTYPDIYTEFGFDSVDNAKRHINEMNKFEILNITIN